MDRVTLEQALLALGKDVEFLARFKAAPIEVGKELGLDEYWSKVIVDGDRSRLRAAGVSDGISILAGRWFKDDVADSQSSDSFEMESSLALAEVDLPKNLVFAAGCSHVPDLLARPEVDPPDAVARLTAGYARLKEKLVAANLDTLIVTSDCHFQAFNTAAFVVGKGTSHHGSMEFFKRADLDLSLYGDPALANALIDTVRSHGLEVEMSSEVLLDHGLIVPLRQMLPRADLPVIPVITQPSKLYSPFNARAFGHAMRDAIAQAGKRVGILATGGLSHWLDPGLYGRVDEKFDNYLLDMLKAGRGIELANLEPFPLLAHGQYEFMNWLIMLGVVGGGVKGEVYTYEPMQASGGGWTVVHMELPEEAINA